jgi:pantoate--beta-alanine ligase
VGDVAHVIVEPASMRAWADDTHARGRSIALVPTMGALHRGHLELIGAARERADDVVVSIFVNPLQFGEQADFDHYPRPIDDDLRACDEVAVDAVYAPTAATMYPHGFASTVHVSGLSDGMEGASRPGHFDGVTTVVTKLFAAVRPQSAVFGEKDFQQLAIVRRMVSDLDLGVEILAHPTVREPDGLALSSRNRRLSDAQRRAAVCIPTAIRAGIECAASSADAGEVVTAVEAVVGAEPLAELDYVAVFDTATLCPIGEFHEEHRRPGRVRIALAARFGDIRLIDNADLFASP